MSALLTVKNLKVQFATRNTFATAVDDFSLTIAPGECVGLVGESGCGKTTTGLAIMRLLPGNGHIVAGSVELDGVDLASLSEKAMQSKRGNDVALIPQDPMSSLNPTMKIGRQIGEGLRIHRGVSDDEARKRALEVLEMVEMSRGASGPIPVRTVGRPSPARHHRHGSHLLTEATDRGRTDDGARRNHSGTDSRHSR
jgi:peptide/nickel transport system ATP-binding protein